MAGLESIQLSVLVPWPHAAIMLCELATTPGAQPGRASSSLFPLLNLAGCSDLPANHPPGGVLGLCGAEH